MAVPESLPKLLTVEQVAEYLQLHKVTVVRFAREGKLPGFKVGREWRFREEEIEAWLEAHREQVEFAERFNALMDRLGEGIRAAGYGPEDVERLIAEVREQQRTSAGE
jgi:excisionase family DNA binding protein